MYKLKFLNFKTPEIIAVINLKFNQGGCTLGKGVKKIQMKWQTGKIAKASHIFFKKSDII